MYTVAGLAKLDKLRALAVASHRRLPNYPQLPTVAEAGGPPVASTRAALMGVAGTPPAVVDTLQRDVVAALRSSAVRARVEGAGFDIAPMTPKELRSRIAADSAGYAILVREGRLPRV